MALNIKNQEVERLASEVSQMAGVSKTEAIRVALSEKRDHLLSASSRAEGVDRLTDWLETEVWPHLPVEVRGKPLTKAEEEEILGFGPDGV